MYSKIAFSNVKKSIRDYTIYFLTLTFGICLFYMFNSVQAQQAVLKLNASQKSMTVSYTHLTLPTTSRV